MLTLQVAEKQGRYLASALSRGTCVCLVVQGLECAMDSERRRQQRLSRRRELL